MNRTAVNALARRKIADICKRSLLTRCELRLHGCWGEAHAPAHRHKRSWYLNKPDDALWDIRQWVAACNSCHALIEKDAKLTEKMFMKIRGEE